MDLTVEMTVSSTARVMRCDIYGISIKYQLRSSKYHCIYMVYYIILCVIILYVLLQIIYIIKYDYHLIECRIIINYI